MALLELRNTPRDDIIGSPMQRLQGRRAQTSLPTADSLLKPTTIRPDTVHERMLEYRRRQKSFYDRGSKLMEPITKDQGIRVWTPNGWKPAEYIKSHAMPNSHVIKAGEHGHTYRRNRRHIMTTKERPHTATPPDFNIPWVPLESQHRKNNAPGTKGTNPTQVDRPDEGVPESQHGKGDKQQPVRPNPTQLNRPRSRTRNTPQTTQAPIRPTRPRKNPVWMKDYVT